MSPPIRPPPFLHAPPPLPCRWWLTYPRYPGRGWTFDDPDAWANLLIVAPSLMYFAYNVYIQQHPEQYGSYDLYVQADIAFWVGSIMYLLAALRDGACPPGERAAARPRFRGRGWLGLGGSDMWLLARRSPLLPRTPPFSPRIADGYFYWMPTGGQCPYGLDSYQPVDPERDAAARAATGADKVASGSGKGGMRAASRVSSVSGLLRAAGVAALSGAGWVAKGVRYAVAAPVRMLRGGRPEGQALMGGSTQAMGMV